MKTLGVLICAGSLLLNSVPSYAQDGGYATTASNIATKEARATGDAVAAKGKNTQKSKKNDQAAAINMVAGAAGAILGRFINQSVVGEFVSSMWDSLWGEIGTAHLKTVNCPAYAVSSTETVACETGTLGLGTGACQEISAGHCMAAPPVPDPVTGRTIAPLLEADPIAAVCPTQYELTYMMFAPVAPDVAGMLTSLVRVATNMFLAEANSILVQFAGEEGHVTDQWVGPPNYNKIVEIMGDVAVKSQKFGSLKFNPKEYDGLKNPDNATPRELMEYRAETLVNDQRSLTSNSVENYKMRYNAQQRSIRALATAMQLKQSLKELAGADALITAEYRTKPQALNTAASRRVLYDALTELKMNVVAARVKMRAETLELNFERISQNPTEDNTGDDGGVPDNDTPIDPNANVGD